MTLERVFSLFRDSERNIDCGLAEDIVLPSQNL